MSDWSWFLEQIDFFDFPFEGDLEDRYFALAVELLIYLEANQEGREEMYDFSQVQVGKIIRNARQKQGLSVTKAATQLQLVGCDVSAASLYNYELGRTRLQACELAALSEIYQTDLLQQIREQANL